MLCISDVLLISSDHFFSKQFWSKSGIALCWAWFWFKYFLISRRHWREIVLVISGMFCIETIFLRKKIICHIQISSNDGPDNKIAAVKCNQNNVDPDGKLGKFMSSHLDLHYVNVFTWRMMGLVFQIVNQFGIYIWNMTSILGNYMGHHIRFWYQPGSIAVTYKGVWLQIQGLQVQSRPISIL